MPENDQDIINYIENLPRHLTFTRIAEACRKRFGPRSWSRSRIVRYWYRVHPAGRGKPSRLELDVDVRLFVEDRLGRQTLAQIVSACRAEFGLDRAPSSAGIHRHWTKIRRALKRR